MFQADKKPILFNKELTGNPITFNSRLKNMPFADCKVSIPIMQEGNGTPSPVNVRNFIGVNSLAIGDISDNQYKTFLNGVINGTYGFVDLGDFKWTYEVSESTRFYTNDITDISLEANFTDMLCSNYDVISSEIAFIKMPDKSIKRGKSKSQISIRDSDYTDAETFTTAVTGKYLIYELAEQTAPSYTLEQFNALCQAFGVTGVSLSFVFGQTIYSGILDVKTGVLSVTHELKTIDENSDLTISNGIFALDNFFDIEGDTDSTMCNVYQRGTNQQNTTAVMNNNPDYSFCCRSISTKTRLMIKDTRFATVEDYKTWLENNPVKIAVKLAEPIQIPLGGYLIEAFKGENNLISSVGTITAKIVEVK